MMEAARLETFLTVGHNYLREILAAKESHLYSEYFRRNRLTEKIGRPRRTTIVFKLYNGENDNCLLICFYVSLSCGASREDSDSACYS